MKILLKTVLKLYYHSENQKIKDSEKIISKKIAVSSGERRNKASKGRSKSVCIVKSLSGIKFELKMLELQSKFIGSEVAALTSAPGKKHNF